jgi:transposase-like protein
MTAKEAPRTARPDPEVKPPVQRRTFSKAEKLRILEEADACSEPGEIGALVRREGIYTSYLSRWRRARERGELRGSKARQRGRKAAAEPEQAAELTELRQENAQLRTRLQQAETIIEVQKKLSQLLGPETKTTERTESA